MKAAVRLDDITPDMDWDSFEAFEALCDRFGVCPLLGIVPQNRDPKLSVGEVREDFWEKIRALRVFAPVKLGDVLLSDCAGTGADIVATKTVERRMP